MGRAGQVGRACATRDAHRVGLALGVAALWLAGALGVGVYLHRLLDRVVRAEVVALALDLDARLMLAAERGGHARRIRLRHRRGGRSHGGTPGHA